MPSKKYLEWSIRFFKMSRIVAWIHVLLCCAIILIAYNVGTDYFTALKALGLSLASVWLSETGMEHAGDRLKNKEYKE